MARQPINPPNALIAPKDFILPDDWDKNLKIKFSDNQKRDIELKVERFIIRHIFKTHSLSFEEVESRLTQILDGIKLILKGFPYPHTNNMNDQVHTLIDYEISHQLNTSNNSDNDIIFGMKMNEILDIQKATTSTLEKLKAAHPPLPAHRPSDENADWLIYDLGLIFEKNGGKFFMPKDPGPNHPFYSYLTLINNHMPTDLQLSDSGLINRSIKLIGLRKNTQKETKT